jgi:hypothetical protein
MATLIPKFDVMNGGSTPAGAINRAINEKLSDVISVKDFGAKGDGSTNDQPAIQAAIAYAQTFSIRNIYFPSGDYYVTSGIVFSTNVGIDCASSTIITASNNTFPVVTLAPANYSNTILNIPSIVNGSIGLYLYGTALAQINIANIANSTNGLVLAVDNTNKTCADNVINFTVINGNAEAAIKFAYNATTTTSVLMQGNQIKGNFAVSCKYGVYFYDVNNGSLGANLPWDDTYVDVFAIDPALITGSIGFYANANFPAARCFLSAKGYFDAMDDAYIKGTCINNPIFAISNSGQYNYTKFKQTGPCRIVNFSSPQGNLWGISPIPAMTTTYNTLATFNGGVPLTINRNLLSFTLATPLAAGDAKAFYFYHIACSPYSPKVMAEPLWEAAMYVNYCNECSTAGAPVPGAANPYPLQGVFAVRATAAVAAGTYYVAVTVQDVPQ